MTLHSDSDVYMTIGSTKTILLGVNHPTATPFPGKHECPSTTIYVTLTPTTCAATGTQVSSVATSGTSTTEATKSTASVSSTIIVPQYSASANTSVVVGTTSTIHGTTVTTGLTITPTSTALVTTTSATRTSGGSTMVIPDAGIGLLLGVLLAYLF